MKLEAHDLTCIRDDRTLFENLSFHVEPGQVLLLEGRNGSGKTSLLRTLCAIRLPDGGKITWNGEDIFDLGPEYHAHTAYVGHKDGVKLELTPVENLTMAKGLGDPNDDIGIGNDPNTGRGSYNPDWAVLVEMDGQQRLFFVIESKGSLFSDALRPSEQAKIDCGREHFRALGSDVDFRVSNKYSNFSEVLT